MRIEKRQNIEIIQGKSYDHQIKRLMQDFSTDVYYYFAPKRRRFLQQTRRQKRKSEFSDYFPVIPHEGLMRDIAETIAECSDIFRVQPPTLGFFKEMNLDTSFQGPAALFLPKQSLFSKDRIYINVLYLSLVNMIYEKGSLQQIASVRESVHELFGHEMSHVYQLRRYPSTARRTAKALKTGGYEYHNNWGEKFANLFGQQYAAIKKRQPRNQN